MNNKVLLQSFEKNVYYVAEDKDDGPYMTKNEEPSKNDTLLFTSENLFDAECYLCNCCENWYNGEEDSEDDYE